MRTAFANQTRAQPGKKKAPCGARPCLQSKQNARPKTNSTRNACCRDGAIFALFCISLSLGCRLGLGRSQLEEDRSGGGSSEKKITSWLGYTGLRSGSEPRIFPEKAASGTSEKLSPRAAGAYSFVLSRPCVALPINKTLVDGELG